MRPPPSLLAPVAAARMATASLRQAGLKLFAHARQLGCRPHQIWTGNVWMDKVGTSVGTQDSRFRDNGHDNVTHMCALLGY